MQEKLEVGSHVFIVESNRIITEVVAADPETEGIIKIKCPICKAVVAVSFHKKTIRTV